MAQRHIDILMKVTDSRYRLSIIVGRRAGQLKNGIPSTLTGRTVARGENVVSAAVDELAHRSGVIWGYELPSTESIGRVIK